MKGIWNNNEVKDLFSEVEDCKEKNKSLKLAFIAHAQKYGRKPNSVRNYYYHEVDNLKLDGGRLKALGINLQNHSKNSIAYFSKDEEGVLMKKVEDMVKRGMSVRKACLTLSNGDVNLMLRFQNKYRNYLAKSKPKPKNTLPDNVIAFRKTAKTLTDGEVQSLFMGLVRLVKRNALEESEMAYQNKLNKANELLRKAIVSLKDKERDENKLKEEITKLKTENLRLTNLNLQLKCSKATALREKLEER